MNVDETVSGLMQELRRGTLILLVVTGFGLILATTVVDTLTLLIYVGIAVAVLPI